MPVANSLAYYDSATIRAVKSFLAQAQRGQGTFAVAKLKLRGKKVL
jgi:hypothetical protein